MKIPLECDVVSEIEPANARSVAAAPDIFQKEGIIEARKLCFRKPDLAADVETDPAGTDTVAGRMPFANVERITQRANKLGKPNALRL
jgi:hypothetical protein